jgi:hypothetical protein
MGASHFPSSTFPRRIILPKKGNPPQRLLDSQPAHLGQRHRYLYENIHESTELTGAHPLCIARIAALHLPQSACIAMQCTATMQCTGEFGEDWHVVARTICQVPYPAYPILLLQTVNSRTFPRPEN